ncbi:uncharacterized protein LOC133948633 [Platichthys flesus]|uniref:uncharacterized protein LOC133948633 n=1 Tax=Platichthys flesus TaxID=8260 RepID=UPI002DBD8BB9|nr:uncharacterized protein LOC133948633 [Platichthys flesus]XP_062238495.1 uncharacterized protein LOC133948633 [Platichthys flesus]
MLSGCSHSQDRAYPAVQHQCNNVTPAPVVHPANGIQVNMVAPQDPEELRVGSYVNNNATLQQKDLSCAYSVGTSSLAPQRKTVGVSAQTFPLRVQGCSGPLKQTSSPLQCALLKRNCRQGRSSLDALSCEHIVTQNLVHSRTPRYQQDLTRPSPVHEIKPLTDVEIHDYIAKEVKHYRRTQSTGNLPTSSDKVTQQYVEVQHVSSAELGIAALGKAHPVDSSKGSKVNAEFTQTSDCPTVPSERHSTEYLQLMRTVAVTGTENEDKSPVVLISRPGRTLGELTEKEHCNKPKEESTSMELNINWNLKDLPKVTGGSWSPKRMMVKEEEDARLNPDDNVGWTVDFDSLHGVTDASVDPQSSVITGNQLLVLYENQDTFPNRRKTSEDQHFHITDQEAIAHPLITSSVHKIQIHSVMSISPNQSELLWNQASHQCVMEDALPVHLQTDLSLEVTEKIANVQKLPLLPKSKSLAHALKLLKDQKYEDISDYEDVSQVMTKLPNTGHEKCSFLPCAENTQYEDVNEEENPEKKRLAQEIFFPENKEQSLSENEGHGHVQAQVKTESISEEKLISLDTAKLCTCPCLVETDDGFENVCPKCDSETQLGVQTNHLVSCSPSYEDFEDGNESDDQMDDFIVLPISITDIIFESENEIQDIPEIIVQDDSKSGDKDGHLDMIPTDCPVPTPVTASASYNMEVFDTVESFLQAKAAQFGNSFEMASGRSTPEHKMGLEGDTHTPNRSRFLSEPGDSETEDSCDYSAPLPPETDDYASEHNEATNVQKGQSRRLDNGSFMEKPNKLIEAKASSRNVQNKTIRQRYSKKQDIIIVDSDTEDESDQNFRRKAKRKRSPSSGSMDYGDAPWGQQIGHPPETLDSLYQTLKETEDLPVPNRTELSHSTAASGKHLENKAGHKHVQQDTTRKNIKSVIILDSDTEDECDQNNEKENNRRSISPAFMKSAILSCITQKRHSPEIVDSEYGPTKEKLQEMRSSAERPDLSLCEKNAGQLIEAKVGSEYVQHKSNKQTTSRIKVFLESDNQISKKKATERTPPSFPKESGVISPQTNRQSTEIVNRLCGTAKTRPRKTILLSEQLPERLRPLDKKADSTTGTCPVTPRHLVKNNLKLSKELVNRQGKDETPAPKTPTATGKKKNSFEKKTLSKAQASIIKPRPRRQARPGSSHPDRVPKQRRNSHDSATPLMKRAMSEAKHLTKARNRDIEREKRSNVGVGYKWLESRKKV